MTSSLNEFTYNPGRASMADERRDVKNEGWGRENVDDRQIDDVDFKRGTSTFSLGNRE